MKIKKNNYSSNNQEENKYWIKNDDFVQIWLKNKSGSHGGIIKGLSWLWLQISYHIAPLSSSHFTGLLMALGGACFQGSS